MASVMKNIVIVFIVLTSKFCFAQNALPLEDKKLDSVVYSRMKIDTLKIDGYLFRPLNGQCHFFIPDIYFKKFTLEDYFNAYIKKVLNGEGVVDSVFYIINFRTYPRSIPIPFPGRSSLQFLNEWADSIFLFEKFNYDKFYKYRKKNNRKYSFSVYYLKGTFIRVEIPISFEGGYRAQNIEIDRNNQSYVYYILINQEVDFWPLYETWLRDGFKRYLKYKKTR